MSMQGLGLRLILSNKIYKLGKKVSSNKSTLSDLRKFSSKTHRTRDYQDQKSTPQCVGYSIYHYLRSTPAIQSKLSPTDIYFGAQRFDEWDGENYEGSSVSGGMNFLINHPQVDINSFLALEDIYAVLAHLQTSPVCAGTIWTTDMFVVDKNGFVQTKGSEVGGHAYLIVGYKLYWLKDGFLDWERSYVKILNSWGKGWGQNGFAKITIWHFARLFNQYSEFLVPTKI